LGKENWCEIGRGEEQLRKRRKKRRVDGVGGSASRESGHLEGGTWFPPLSLGEWWKERGWKKMKRSGEKSEERGESGKGQGRVLCSLEKALSALESPSLF
jgi:hypothetical protein